MYNSNWVDIETFLTGKNWLNLQNNGEDFKLDSLEENYILKYCPVCNGGASSDENTFSMRKKDGVSHCFRSGCGWQGNLFKLKSKLFPSSDIQLSQITDIMPEKKFKTVKLSDWETYFEKPLYEVEGEEALKYLTETRLFSLETLKNFHIGFKRFKNISFIAIPYFDETCSNIIKIKYRSVGNPNDGKKIMFSEEGMKGDVLYNLCAIHDNKEIFVTEGELDTLTLWQLGFKNVVSLSSGVGSKKCLDKIKTKEKIYLLYDHDLNSQKSAYNTAKFLGLNKTLNIFLGDYKDPNEILQKEGQEKAKEIISTFINKAKKFDLEYIISFATAINGVIEEELFGQQLGETSVLPNQVSFPFDNIHKIVGGLIGGDLIILSGQPGMGKTSFLLQMAFETAKKGIPVFFFCMEMPFKRLARKVIQYALGVDKITPNHLETISNTFSDLPLYFINKIQSFNKEWVFNVIEESIVRHDLGLVIFDNLHLICRDNERYIREEIGKAVQNFKLLSEKFNIPILLIAQLRKVDSSTIPTAIDLRESNALVTDPDIIMFLYRQPLFSTKGVELDGTESMELFSKNTLVRVEKNRYKPTGEGWLVFEGEKSTFREMKDDHERISVLQEKQQIQQMRKAKRFDNSH